MTASSALAARPAQESWTVRALRAVVVLHVIALLAQAVTAGLLLSSPGGRPLHLASAIAVTVLGLLHLVLAILVWRPGGGPAKFVPLAASMLVFTVVAAALGMAHVKAVHVPLGVMLFGGGVMQLQRVMSRPATA
ncbi:hypothetical protein [Nonomuraea jiangxiensis]|uniref:Integral membrane protein n=1 Tax=Nonomuraea jiangxiensis TaxID=633440 RepID=A0A1G8Y6A0_9ACTN|nr:hypothetical protein [Nonomuraea jiangxiensis]SDJ97685.1 hypothetical protein SAMN05421869_113167 [Nonomuraea jiangxiensis]